MSHETMHATEARETRDSWQALLPWAVVGVALVLLVYRMLKYGGHFPDDAYITIRFAEHLAQGLGIVWNVGGPPVEGSTSFLQTLIYSGAFVAGLAVRTAAYAMAGLSVVALILLIWRINFRLTGHFGLAAALALAMYVSGVQFAVHFNSGMETMLSMALLVGSLLAALRLVDAPTAGAGLLLAAVNFLALWCRPDAAVYLFGQGLVLGTAALIAWAGRRETALFRALVVSYGVLVVAGAAFLAWKQSYFGYVLPNSFYVKSADPAALKGLGDVQDFLRMMGLRLLILAPLLVFIDPRALIAGATGRTAARIGLLVVPVVCFLAYNATTLHLVGFFFRFEYPVVAFFWIGAGWLLTAGRAVERLQAVMARLTGAALSPLAAAGLAVVAMGVLFQFDRPAHSQWFRWVEELHYEPIAEALKASGAGPNGTLVFDSAGFIPYRSGFSLIDPVGLTDNVLSGREPITPEEREAYIWGAKPDVYLGPVPPASPGAETGADDPRIDSAYVQDVLLRRVVFAGYSRFMDQMSYDERRDVLFLRMRELRDNYIAVGEMPYPIPNPPEYTHFLYVRKDSPYAAKLIEALGKLVTRPVADIDFDDILKGQVPHDAQSLRAIRDAG